MFSNYFLALLLAHLAGDFVFQNDWLCNMKVNPKKIFLGVSIHAVIILVINVFVFEIFFKEIPWIMVFFISLFHWVIDLLKSIITIKLEKFLNSKTSSAGLKKEINRWIVPLFFFDQAIHLLSIFIVAYILNSFEFTNYANFYYQFVSGKVTLSNSLTTVKKELLILIYLCLATSVSNVVVKILLGGLKKDLGSDPKTGRYIGALERILTIAIVLAGAWQALAVLYGSKTAIRFEQTKNNPDFAEYYILGTSLSALFGVLIAVAAKISLFF